MKVALVCPYDLGRFGGVQDQVGKLRRWLVEAGHDAWIVGPGETGPDGARLVGPVRVVRANASDTPIALDPRVVRKVTAALAGADVVHVHEPLMPVVSLAAMRTSQRVVATVHADPPAVVRRALGVARPLVRRILGRAAVLTAVSPAAAAPIPPGLPFRLVPNGVDLDAARPSDDRDEAAVVFLGRDDPRKGLDILLDAWGRVTARVPAASLTVIGADRGGALPAGVTFLGRVDEATKQEVLGRSGVLCAPNTRGESFGIIVAEGMAAGCTVVASALQGFVHVGGDAVLFVAPSDPAGLAGGLERALTDGALRARLRSAAAGRITRFGREAVLSGYLAAYRDALAR